jgi:hypothetical protein
MKYWYIPISSFIISVAFISAAFTHPHNAIMGKLTLGKKLFLEKILYKDSSLTCSLKKSPGLTGGEKKQLVAFLKQ